MQKEDQNRIWKKVQVNISKSALAKKNKNKSWSYGYDPKYDFVVISKTGQIGDVINISGAANIFNISTLKSPKILSVFPLYILCMIYGNLRGINNN